MKVLILLAGIAIGGLSTGAYMSSLIPYQPQDTKLMDACLSAWQSRMKSDNALLAELAGIWGETVKKYQENCR